MATKKIRITIIPLEESFRESRKFFSDLDKGILKKHGPILNFEDFNAYRRILTKKRLELLKIIKLKKPETVKALSIIARRDFKNIYEDVKMLEALGLVKIKKNASGFKPVVVYDGLDIKIKIPLQANL